MISITNYLPKSKDEILTNIKSIFSGATSFVRGNPILVGSVVGVGSGLATTSVVKSVTKRRKKKSKRKTTKTKRRTSKRRKTKARSKRKSSKRIKYTKTGQPYITLKSGKARFIKRSSAKRMKKLKGGYY